MRTGDLGRINDDGFLELRGRKDDRVKIRGNRIELSEIDRALETASGYRTSRSRCCEHDVPGANACSLCCSGG